MICEPFVTPEGVRGIMCSRGGRRRCSACKRTWATLECDFPTPARKSGTCDKPLCRRCAISKGDNLDFCPHHPEGGLPGPDQMGLGL